MGAVLAAGDHVTIGKARTVWRIDFVDGDTATLDRVSGTKYQRRSVLAHRLNTVDTHTRRADPNERPQNCDACGCYREVAR